jgi:5-formyltetrahydrofolate cyclo-ligase
MAQPDFHAIRCGIGFAAQVLAEVPHDERDLPIGLLVTEEGVLRFP